MAEKRVSARLVAEGGRQVRAKLEGVGEAGIVRGHAIALTPLPGACPRRVVLGWRTTSPHAQRFREIAAIFRQSRQNLRQQQAEGTGSGR